jgi:hypothetical protein
MESITLFLIICNAYMLPSLNDCELLWDGFYLAWFCISETYLAPVLLHSKCLVRHILNWQVGEIPVIPLFIDIFIINVSQTLSRINL